MSFGRSLALCTLLLTCPALLPAQDSVEPPAPATPSYSGDAKQVSATTVAQKEDASTKPKGEKKAQADDKPKRKKGKRKNPKPEAKTDDTPKDDPKDTGKSKDPADAAKEKPKPDMAKPEKDPKPKGKGDKKVPGDDGDKMQSDKPAKKDDIPANKNKKKKPPAKNPKQKKAYTSLDEVDEDFAFQGEFAGDILPDDTFDTQGQQQIGLQVVAMGDGKFQAMRYPIGLPGVHWFSGYKEKLTGMREGDVLTLKGDDTHIEISDNRAVVRSTAGNLLGEFPRIRRKSPTLGAEPPSNATVLFDGTNTDHFKEGKILEDGTLKMGTEFVKGYKDFTLHLEFMLPYMPHATGQARSNSGVYMLSRYEVQILDTFGLDAEFNHCGALYRYQKPNVNMCLPPLTWQTYDITFFSPKFDSDGKKTTNGVLTVLHNGVKIHDNFQVERKTGAGRPEGPDVLPTKLQDHGNPVKFRNIWLVDHSNNAASETVPQSESVPQSEYVDSPFINAPPVSEEFYPPIESNPIYGEPVYIEQ